MERVLITGGSGLIGTHLTNRLLEAGYAVRHLNRTKRSGSKAEQFTWDLKAQTVEAGAFEGVDHIIHLAGAGIVDKRWTDARKKVLMDSRVETANLLHEAWKASGQPIKTFIGASGISIYGTDTTDHIYTETDPAAPIFVADICVEWEKAAARFAADGVRTVTMRIGIVFAVESGALPKMSAPVKYGLGAAIGSGKQWIPWIHIHDLVSGFMLAIEQPRLSGTYNLVGPNGATSKQLTKAMGTAMSRPVFLPNVPGFLLKMMMGEMAQLILGGSRISSEKIEAAGLQFRFPELEGALRDLWGK